MKLMSFIVLTTIAHAFNYGSITVYQNGIKNILF